VEFSSHEIASQVLACYNGAPIPGTNKNFRLNWGIFGGGTKTTTLSNAAAPMQKMVQTTSPDYSIYVGDIDAQVNDMMLLEFFQKRYKSVVSAKVIVDPITKYSKGYGFVKFSNFEESQRAISEMQGSLLRGRHIKTSQSF
jgi:RNA recognition motif-containing protein